ncbi:MAG: pyruvate kinase, partial [Desulfofustis sp.]|nr:pyruvate kinase [Desulfofustis sp.]
MNLARRIRYWSRYLFTPNRFLLDKYQSFREVLHHDRKSLELLGDLEDISYSGTPVDWARITRLITALRWSIGSLIRSLAAMHPGRYRELEQRFQQLETQLLEQMALPVPQTSPPYIISVAEAAGAPHLSGGKAHALGNLLRDTALPQPAGFVITTSAGNLLFERNELRPRLDELLGEITLNDAQRLSTLSAEIVALIEAAEIPEEVSTAVWCRLAEFTQRQGGSPERWAVRSSAIGEDSAFSFAGQYVSLLSVAPDQVLAAYKKVLAGKYRPGALAYRIRCGLADQEAAMAALVMEMIEARAGGVIYTRDPAVDSADEGKDTLAIYAVSGLGERLVNGSGQPEIHRFVRTPGRHTETIREIDHHQRPATRPSLLDRPTARLLADWGLQLEVLAGRPLDIEWCQDHRGTCLLLQCRPLNSGEREAATEPTDPAGEPIAPLLLEGGTCAAPGIGIGTVHILRDVNNLGDLPTGSVLVLSTVPPTLAGRLEHLQAVVAEGGSRASHFATVARESGLPVITGLAGAMTTLAGYDEVTVDAWSCRIYQGRVETLAARYPSRTALLDAPLVARLSRVSALVSPLHLLDPTAASFSPEHCTSMHDLIRYAHEKAMTEMFSLVSPSGRELSGARTVHSDLPLTLSLIDLGGGLTAAATQNQRQITPDRFASPLLQTCWRGLTHPEVTWHHGLAYLDWEQADRVSAGIISLKSPLLGSYGVVAHDYLHLLLRFGYHFTVIDCLAGGDDEANYLAFRFKGGGG